MVGMAAATVHSLTYAQSHKRAHVFKVLDSASRHQPTAGAALSLAQRSTACAVQLDGLCGNRPWQVRRARLGRDANRATAKKDWAYFDPADISWPTVTAGIRAGISGAVARERSEQASGARTNARTQARTVAPAKAHGEHSLVTGTVS